jgi:hypothetical protein
MPSSTTSTSRGAASRAPPPPPRGGRPLPRLLCASSPGTARSPASARVVAWHTSPTDTWRSWGGERRCAPSTRRWRPVGSPPCSPGGRSVARVRGCARRGRSSRGTSWPSRAARAQRSMPQSATAPGPHCRNSARSLRNASRALAKTWPARLPQRRQGPPAVRSQPRSRRSVRRFRTASAALPIGRPREQRAASPHAP